VRVDHQWATAFLWEQRRLRAEHRTRLFLAQNREWTQAKFSEWFQNNLPDVILGYNPTIITWLQALGKRVPEDVGFVNLWNSDQSGKYAGLYHNPPAIGTAAADFLIALLQCNERGVPKTPQTILLNATWVDGASLLGHS
jgi:LacI family transcriptional regulator